MPTTPSAVPAGRRTLTHGPAGTKQIALTVDDGYCDQCVAGYVDLAQRTGIHLTLSPNGTYSHIWSKYADHLKPLLERSQVQIINHTFSHKDLVLWNGSYSDPEAVTPQFLMSQARKYLQPGTIMLGHANHATVLGLFDQIQQLIRERGLTPVTLDEMFGTSRS